MVRAILAGHKTQTRRIVKDTGLYAIEERFHGKETADREKRNLATQCKHGQPGERLWVKETHQAHPIYGSPVYAADYQTDNNPVKIEGWPWRPSIFMPRRWSRITLEITDVRVERLQDISEADALAEGVNPEDTTVGTGEIDGKIVPWFPGAYHPHFIKLITHRSAYACLWDSLNAKRGFGWETNPWVWAITFKIIV